MPMFTFFRYSFRTALLTLLSLFILQWTIPSDAHAAGIRPFSSDGCSLFPDGTIKDRNKWCDCCLSHDIAYWQGGAEEDRKKADEALRECVLDRTRDRALAETMYIGVRAGGHPAFPTWYRWGYGWPYGRGFKPLSDAEKIQVQEGLGDYFQKHPSGYCEKHVPKITESESAN